MPAHGGVLAEAISAKVTEITATLERLSDEQWRLTCLYAILEQERQKGR